MGPGPQDAEPRTVPIGLLEGEPAACASVSSSMASSTSCPLSHG